MGHPVFPLLLVVALPSSILTQTPSTVVQTSLGPVQGFRKTVGGTDVDVYLGIPFARPPVGELRFKPPVETTNWTDVMNVTELPNSCHQTDDTAFDRFRGVEMWNANTNKSEDCLYLNAWVPRGSTSPRTTMVWIYGGGFWGGSSTLEVYDGSNLAAAENVIVFSFNYRVGPLGFLYTGTEEAPGNMGLLDQVMALQWIHTNVEAFGGANNSITIFGESAGATSVSLHLLSPLSKDYFTRAIMQSSSAFSPFQLQTTETARTRASKLAKEVDCPDSPVQTMVQCLRGKDAETLTVAQWNILDYYFDVPHPTVVDGYFLPENPHDLVRKGQFKDTEILLGANKDEGVYFLIYAFPDDFPYNNSREVSDSRFRELVKQVALTSKEDIVDDYIFEYSGSEVPAQRRTNRELVSDMSGDDLFLCPTVDFALAWVSAGQQSVFHYSFQYTASNYPWPQWTGLMHGYEIPLVFGLPEEGSYTQLDREVAARVMKYWATFAETGNPNSGPVTAWPALTAERMEYLAIKGDGDEVHDGLRYRKCAFQRRIASMTQDAESTPAPVTCPTSGSAAPFTSWSFYVTIILTRFLIM